jgi:PAS domain S-box-containing protein
MRLLPNVLPSGDGPRHILLWSFLCVAVALGVQLATARLTAGVAPLATFYLAVTIAALAAGRTAGWLTLFGGVIASWYFLIAPHYAFGMPSPDNLVRLTLFVINGAILVLVCGAYRGTLAKARASEEDASRSSKLLEAVGAASPDLIYAKDRAFRTIYANPATLKILGVSAEEVLGRTAAEYSTISDEGEAHASNDARVMETGQVEVSFETFTSPDGSTRTFRSSKAPLRDAEGAIIGIAGVSIDVTEQMAVEAELRSYAARLRLALDAGRMAVWEHDAATDTIKTSPEFNRLFGYSEDAEVTIDDLRARYYPGERERLRGAAIEAIMRNERFFEAEFRLYTLEGDLRWYVLRAEIEMNEGGVPLRTTGVVLDITSRKQVEEALLEREAELKAALDAGSLAVADYDHTSGRFRPSPRLNALYGFPPEHELTIEDVRSRYHPDYLTTIESQRSHDAQHRELTSFDWTIHLLLPDGSERWVEGLGEYIRDEEGRITRSRGVVLDITPRKTWELHQRLLVDELNHRVKNTLAIVQSLAHQTFRTAGISSDVRRAFEGRLEALAVAHNVLTRENWEAADLREIAEGALQAHRGSSILTISGPSVRLEPKTAVTLAMALHELATNAVKYGALSVDGGQVSVTWSVEGVGEPRLRLVWEERGGPPVTPPATRGFGSRMIERALASELKGSVTLDFAREGLSCTIDAPLPQARELRGGTA